MRFETRGNGTTLYCHHYDSLADLVDRTLVHCKDGYQGKAIVDTTCRDGSWTGRSFAGAPEIARALHGVWGEGMALVETMRTALAGADLPPPVTRRRRPTWTDDGDFSLDRALVGLEAFRGARRGMTRGPASLALFVRANSPCGHSWQQMFWRSALAIVLADVLETAGYRVSIRAVAYVRHAYVRPNENLLQVVSLKDEGAPVDALNLANGLAPWLWRTLGLCAYHFQAGRESNVHCAYGYPVPPGDALLRDVTGERGDVLVIDEVYDEAAAVHLAREVLARYSGGSCGQGDQE